MTLPSLEVSLSDPQREEKLITRILDDFQAQYGLDLSRDPVAKSRITEGAQKALMELTTKPEAVIDLPFISANQSGPIHLKRKIVQAGLAPAAGGGDAEDSRVRIQLPDGKSTLTTVLLAMMIAVYALQWLTIFLTGKDIPAALGMKVNQLIIDGQYWRLVTAMFLHGSILHLGFNLYALNILGRRIERFFGLLRFLGLFLIAGVIGNLLSFLLTSAPSLGSSTAIFGLLGAEAIFIYQHRDLLGKQYRTALGQIVQVAVVNLVIGFLVPGIDNWGHIGGLIGGAIFTWFGGPLYRLSEEPPVLKFEDQREEIQALYAFLGLLALVIALTAWLVSR